MFRQAVFAVFRFASQGGRFGAPWCTASSRGGGGQWWNPKLCMGSIRTSPTDNKGSTGMQDWTWFQHTKDIYSKDIKKHLDHSELIFGFDPGQWHDNQDHRLTTDPTCIISRCCRQTRCSKGSEGAPLRFRRPAPADTGVQWMANGQYIAMYLIWFDNLCGNINLQWQHSATIKSVLNILKRYMLRTCCMFPWFDAPWFFFLAPAPTLNYQWPDVFQALRNSLGELHAAMEKLWPQSTQFEVMLKHAEIDVFLIDWWFLQAVWNCFPLLACGPGQHIFFNPAVSMDKQIPWYLRQRAEVHQWRSGFEARTSLGEIVLHEIAHISEVGTGLWFNISVCIGWQAMVLQVFEIADSTISEMLQDAAHLNLNSGLSYCMTKFSKISKCTMVVGCFLRLHVVMRLFVHPMIFRGNGHP